MQGTSVPFGQILAVFGIVIAGVWGATQWTAAHLGFSYRLGAPWFDCFGVPIYHPWGLFEWWYWFNAYAPHLFLKGGEIAALSGAAAVVVAIGMSIWRARQSKLVTTYGSVRWAEADEVSRAGLTGPSGVFLGSKDCDYLRHDGPEHVMVFAPTRSGKGAGLVVPSLLAWPHSALITDQGDNWKVTAGFRASSSHCLYFNPNDLNSANYNPLLEVRRGLCEVRDVQNIADILVDPEGALERRNHWEKTSHSLLVGAILHVLYAEPDKTLPGVANFLSDPKQPIEQTLRSMMKTPHLGDRPHPVVASAARELLNKSDNERSGVLSTAMSFLGLYRDPIIAQITSRCDWRIADLVDADHPVSLYLVVPPSDISRTKPLIRLLLNQIVRRLTESLKGEQRRRKLLLMLDEFPALGRLDFFETELAFIAGYGLRAFLIAQSLNQIEKAYGPNNSILDNCHVRVAFASNDERTPTPKIDPERVALRASPRPVTRLNRRTLAALGGTLAILVSVGALWALRSHGSKHGGAQQSYNVDRVAKAEELDRLPPDYSKLASKSSPTSAEPPPEFGPPLPGDWAPAALQGGRGSGSPAGNSPSAEGIDRQRSAEDIARSSVFFQTSSAGKAGVDANASSITVGPTASMGAFNPMTPPASPRAAQRGDPTTIQNRQDQKEAFLAKTGDAATRNSAELQAPASPYTVMAGTNIPAALVTGINSDLPGQVIATVTQPIYDTGTGRYLLIPQGSRLLGRYDSQVAFGQRRVLLVWTRLILPDTSSIALDKLPGIDPAGYAGLEDGVDWHWGRILSGAALATLLGVSSDLAVSNQGSTNGNVVIALRNSAQDTTNQVGQEITRRNLSVQPTLTVRPGFPMDVMVNKDLVLRPYQPLFFQRGTSQ